MKKKLFIPTFNKPSVSLLIIALVVGGISAQAAGVINSPSGGYLVCVNSKTKVITHPGTSSCPKGSKTLVLGAQGIAGADGKTLWNGVKDPESTLGAPGDMFINTTTKTLFGPKDLTTSWPLGVSMVGAAGPQGPGGSGSAGTNGTNGTNGTIAITELFVCDGSDAGTVADEKCKIGMTGPGGGLIFFVDYNDQYAGFDYLEAAPAELQSTIAWSNAASETVSGAAGWAARAVGRGQENTTAIVTAYPTSGAAVSADAYSSNSYNSVVKSDWFLGSLGEMKLMYDNLQGVGVFLLASYYWSSSELAASSAWYQSFIDGLQYYSPKTTTYYVRPVRAF